ncbi:MAG TPA: RseA family anti-sigma factor [Steroidobacteraceae bacterium]|nr:RseA family anti-sigma factor [Steroidobacteraceae bacterium]
MTEERDSQLSAMFDGELPAGECELLARRLVRDDVLRAQWSRFSMIGAALRAERGVALHDRVALRAQSAIAKEATYGHGADDGNATDAAPITAAADKAAGRRWLRFGYPVAGASIAAGVAAVSIFWLRGVQDPGAENLQANTTVPTTIILAPEPASTTVAVNTAATQPAASAEPGSYTTPAPSSTTSLAPSARLANYVVAHSEYSGPLTRRMALLGIVGAEGSDASVGPDAAPAEDVDAP